MSKRNNLITVKAYGVALHLGFLEVKCLQEQLVERGRITIENQTYQIVSVIQDASDQYSINVVLQREN